MTSTTRSVLETLRAAASRDAPTYGLEICRETGLGPGTVYPILRRLERNGLVRAYWEDDTPDSHGPRRRMYKLTGEGLALAAETQRSRTALRPGWVS
ncbi:PadR family transcriptional regulator [Nonomuraea sp. NPDC048826]|uniref:PadR family transcriptional regulator n=1 Tax=Nonomuraea sp. NPDC048826 TaxID=3364347 RepID=UPI00371D38CF